MDRTYIVIYHHINFEWQRIFVQVVTKNVLFLLEFSYTFSSSNHPWEIRPLKPVRTLENCDAESMFEFKNYKISRRIA
jgi:hypothetical protein